MSDNTKELCGNIIKFSNGKSAILDGPLSRIFTQTLFEVYAKKIQKDTGLSTESLLVQTETAVSDLEKIPQEEDAGMLYAVDSTDTIFKDLAHISERLGKLNNTQLNNTAVILNNIKNEQSNPVTLAIEKYCLSYKVPVYVNLQHYMEVEHNADKASI